MLYKFLNYIPLSFRDSTHRFYKMGLFQKKKKQKMHTPSLMLRQHMLRAHNSTHNSVLLG